MSYDIFLSYSKDDVAIALKLHRRLRRFRVKAQPLRVFFAPAAIAPGESIPRALSHALHNCHHLVALVTPSWVESEWCRLEHDASIWLDPGATDRRLLPCLVADTALPPDLARLSYVDFRDPEHFDVSLRILVDAVRTNTLRRIQRHEAVLAQRAIFHAPLLPWIGFGGPSFDFLWPEMIVDAKVSTRRRPGPRSQMSDWAAGERLHDENLFAVIGDAGAGKTTMLRSLLLSGGRRFPAQRILVHASELLTSTRSLAKQIDQSEPAGLALLVDGLDEAGGANVGSVARALAELRQPNTMVVLAARTDFFDRQYGIMAPYLSDLVEVLELQPWSDEDILEFSRKYSERIGDPSVSLAVGRIIEDVSGVRSLIGNPMRLTLVLYLLASGMRLDALSLQQPYTLYTLFYEEWLRKEKQRGTGGRDPEAVRAAHIGLARWLYAHRGIRHDIGHVLEAIGLDADNFLGDSAFEALLAIHFDSQGRPVLSSFRHETIGEYLVSRDILHSFESGSRAIDNGLETTVGDDVNTYVRSGMLEASPHRLQVFLTNLSTRYYELLPSSSAATLELEPAEAERLREQILYYIGRLPLQAMPLVLRSAYENEPAPLLRRAAALGAILHGDDAIERDYLGRLNDDTEAQVNRSVQMVYFGDVHADLHTFEDRGEEWRKTRDAIFRRFRASGYRDIRLRWWDLRTLRSFLRSRQFADTLNESERSCLQGLNLANHGTEARTQAIRRELELLLEEVGVL
ncbi:MAG: TIR domain-containing protein [Candidatus Binatia bacterium]